MKIKLVSLLWLACALILAGCASVGTKIDMTQVTQIKKGTTTRADLERLFGKPMSVSLMADGRTMAMWFYSEASNRAQNFIPVVNLVQTKIDTHSQMLQVIFTPSGVVENFTTNDAQSGVSAGLVK